MKKSTKKIAMSLFIVLMFGLSSIAYVATSFLSPDDSSGGTGLKSYFVDGYVDPQTESLYIQNGFTWIKFHSAGNDDEFLSFVRRLPDAYSTSSGQIQIIVQKMNSTYNETYLTIESLQGRERAAGTNGTVDSLCRLLTIPPLECALRNMNNTR